MKKKLNNLLFALFAASMLQAEETTQPWSESFESKPKKEMFKTIRMATVSDSAGMDSTRGLVLDKAPTKGRRYPRVMLRRIAIDPATKYRLSFFGRSDGPDNLDNNPQMETLFFDSSRVSKGKPLPGWELLFSDADGKRVKRPFAFFEVIIHGKWHRYTEAFYPPAGSKYLNILFTNRNTLNTVQIDNVKVEQITDEGRALNLNPEFNGGLYDYSGYHVYNTKISKLENGNLAVNASEGAYVMTTPVPVKPGNNYIAKAHVIAVGKRCSLSASMIDSKGKRKLLNLRQRIYGTGEKNMTLELTAGKGDAALSVSFRGGILLSLKIEESN